MTVFEITTIDTATGEIRTQWIKAACKAKALSLFFARKVHADFNGDLVTVRETQ